MPDTTEGVAAPVPPAPVPASVSEPAPVSEPEPEPEPDQSLDPDGRLELPVAGEWKRVSSRYVVVEIVGTVIFGLVLCAGATALWLLAEVSWAPIVLALIAVVTLVVVLFEPRRVRSIGYQLRQDDLLFRRGIMFQRFVSVPYGRMQLIDVTRGPVARWLGLADLKFVTAAASSGVLVPGLAFDDAEALRDRLIELAESRRAGL